MWREVRKMWGDYFKMLRRDVLRYLDGRGASLEERQRLNAEAIADGDRHAEMLDAMLKKAGEDWSREWKRASGVERGAAEDRTGDLE